MQVHVGDLNTVDFLKKTKFPQDFFPRVSRVGDILPD